MATPSALSEAAGGHSAPRRRVAAGLVDQRRVAHIFNFVNLTKMWLTRWMFTYVNAFWALFGLNLMVFGWALYAHARVRATEKALEALDWETLANLTGEVGAIKRSLQKTNNRINGMTSSDPQAILAELPKLQPVTNSNGRMGG